MCLGIPGQVLEFLEEPADLAKVDVLGVTRRINLGLLDDGEVEPGDWVLIHMGFAMEVMDVNEAQQALEGLQLTGSGIDGETVGGDETTAERGSPVPDG